MEKDIETIVLEDGSKKTIVGLDEAQQFKFDKEVVFYKNDLYLFYDQTNTYKMFCRNYGEIK